MKIEKKTKSKIWYLIVILIVTPLLLLGGFYLYILTNGGKEEIEQEQEATVQEQDTTLPEGDLVPDTQAEIEEVQQWDTFFNMDYGYSVDYPNGWQIDSNDLERVWFEIDENSSILFASHTATQTGFPEYELIESIPINIDGIDTTIAVFKYVEDNTVRALLTFFECETYPHFVMYSYNFQNQEQENEIFDLNKRFLESINFL